MELSRRALLLGGASALTVAACSRCESGRAEPPRSSASSGSAELALPPPPSIPEGGVGKRGEVITDTWTIGDDGRAVTIVPAWKKSEERLPLLFALHGRGEALKGPAAGVMGWPKDYALLRAIERVCAPPLTTDDFETFVEPKRLAEHNDALAKRPFEGVVIVCPYSPDVDLRKPKDLKEYSDYFMGSILPRAKKDLPVLGTPASIGIDGVSLGGALALRIGLGNPEAFGAVGTLQPAIGEDQVPEFTDLARAARTKNKALKLRLLTSSKDYFKAAIKSASAAWRSAGIDHDFEDVPGPHDYPFNRGPGSIEMLLWHDRVLSRT